jgi:hypothetical protein
MEKDFSIQQRIEKVLKVAHQMRAKKGYYYRKWKKAWQKGIEKALQKSKSEKGRASKKIK